MPRFSGIDFLKNFVNLSFILHAQILHAQIYVAPQLLFLLYPHLSFTKSSKLTSSANHFLLSPFHTLTDSSLALFDLAPILFISQSFSLYHSQPFRCHHFTAEYCYTVSGNKPPSSHFCLVGFCRHFKSPHSFCCYRLISSTVYIFILYHLILCENIVIIIVNWYNLLKILR